MDFAAITSCSAFAGMHCIARGELRTVAGAVKQRLDHDPKVNILIFDDISSELVEIDFRGSLKAVLSRLPPAVMPKPAPVGTEAVVRTPGRPKLGVVAREVTLLPRHWDWLASQPGGASVALRKLVEAASRASEDKDRMRRAQESAYRFMSAMAGDQPGYEEAVRALFADQPEQFGVQTEGWPVDIRDHARMLALPAFSATQARG
jgi:hypothetical protein